MARQRRTLDEQIADLATRGRTARTETLSVPAMAPLGPTLIADNAILNEHLSPGSVALDNLDDSMQETLTALAGNETAIAEARARLEAEAKRIDSLIEEVENGGGGGGVSEEEVEAVVIREAVLKKIAAGTASFQHADIANLTATGTSHLNEAVIQKLYADVVLSREVVADRVKAGAVDGQRIVGASVETSDEPDAGVKLSDAGLVAHGKGTSSIDGRAYKTRASITNRKTNWSSDATDTWPGLWFNSALGDGEVFEPHSPAGIAAGEADSQAISMRSAVTTDLSGSSSVQATPDYISMGVNAPRSGPMQTPPFASDLTAYPERFSLETYEHGKGTTASVTHEGNGRLNLFGRAGVHMETYGKGLHSDAPITAKYGTSRVRLPLGVLYYFSLQTTVNLIRNTQAWSSTVHIPAFSIAKVTMLLHGYSNVSNQILELSLFANGANVGRHLHHSANAWNGQDSTVTFIYKHNSQTDEDVTFRIVGTNVVPNDRDTTFIMTAPSAGAPPTTEIIIEDIGSLNASQDPFIKNANRLDKTL